MSHSSRAEARRVSDRLEMHPAIIDRADRIARPLQRAVRARRTRARRNSSPSITMAEELFNPCRAHRMILDGVPTLISFIRVRGIRGRRGAGSDPGRQLLRRLDDFENRSSFTAKGMNFRMSGPGTGYSHS